MSMFTANTVEMRAKAQSVQGTIERLRAEVNTMQSSLQELEGTWRGAAAANFQSVVADWRNTQLRVEESLTNINTALGRASHQYDDAEAANASMFTY
ncbi:WXG100 family type VII secretion target [Zhihengliuella halotolerans]|uniref:ESAT-6-like protein n=1 Tax=Zhihengliuella halotolerans TaxID=370736 RepID=A0A4V2G9J5_9MICC|nr:WXG100 family type VII secretion target [Zhihengliuella halotolerans]MCO1339312.1 type VII secretion protein [Kocuria polaris]RZU60596.1 WXG100 family type VII secretion target [Zhihengliuella halotolerans]